MNLHIVSLPHTASRFEWSYCAYTMKALKLARMMEAHGYGVTLYAAEGPSDFHNTVGCVPDPGPSHVVEPEWTDAYFRKMNARVIAEMTKRIKPRDLILLTTGWPQKPIADFFTDHQVVEYGVGYEGVFAPFRVFESYAWAQAVYGREAGIAGESAMSKQGRFYDAVIPNYFEVDQFHSGTGDGGYLLFLGRLIESKGLRIAIDAAKRQVGTTLGELLRDRGTQIADLFRQRGRLFYDAMRTHAQNPPDDFIQAVHLAPKAHRSVRLMFGVLRRMPVSVGDGLGKFLVEEQFHVVAFFPANHPPRAAQVFLD